MFCKNEQRVFYQTVDMFRLRLVLLIPILNTNIDKTEPYQLLAALLIRLMLFCEFCKSSG